MQQGIHPVNGTAAEKVNESVSPAVESGVQPAAPRQGEPTFEKLFVEYHSLVFGVALKFTGRPEDAEDITQEVFTKVWRNLGAFQYDSSIKTWIYRIAMNACIDHSRKPHKRFAGRFTGLQTASDEGEGLELPCGGPDAEGELLSREKALHIRKAVSRLKPHLKAVLVLKDLEGMSYEEISSVLGIGLGTISSRLNRGRRALQNLLQPVLPALLEES